MIYKVGLCYGEYEKYETWDGRTIERWNVCRLENDLCMGGLIWGETKTFYSEDEANAYIKMNNKDNRLFKWVKKKSTRPYDHVIAEIAYEQDILTPVIEFDTWQTVNGTDYLIDSVQA